MFACRVQGCICQNCSTTHIVFRQFAAWRDHPVGLAGRPLSSQQQAWVRFLLVLWVFFLGRVIQWFRKSGTQVATLSGAWCYRVSAGTGRLTVNQGWGSSHFLQNSGFFMVPGVILKIRLNLGRKFLYAYVQYNRELLMPYALTAIASAILS